MKKQNDLAQAISAAVVTLVVLAASSLCNTAEAGPMRQGSSVAPEGMANDASYGVPVPTELSPYSQYQMEPVDLSFRDGQFKMEYTLPPELMGHVVEIEAFAEVDPTSQPVTFKGLNSEISCVPMSGDAQASTDEIFCRGKYTGLTVDMVAVEARLRSSGLAESEVLGRLEVSRLFSTEPIGVFRIKGPVTRRAR
jgi:hypothetical protein